MCGGGGGAVPFKDGQQGWILVIAARTRDADGLALLIITWAPGTYSSGRRERRCEASITVHRARSAASCRCIASERSAAIPE